MRRVQWKQMSTRALEMQIEVDRRWLEYYRMFDSREYRKTVARIHHLKQVMRERGE